MTLQFITYHMSFIIIDPCYVLYATRGLETGRGVVCIYTQIYMVVMECYVSYYLGSFCKRLLIQKTSSKPTFLVPRTKTTNSPYCQKVYVIKRLRIFK